MTFRIHEILLVSSAYDAFVLEEDGSLSDRLFYSYSELDLSWTPRITHAATHARAFQLLAEQRFELVITVVRVGDGDATELSRRIKEQYPEVRVVLLLFDSADLKLFPAARVPETVDHVFQWTGSAGTLIAAIKTVEDDFNVGPDTSSAGVQVILVVEDRVRAYSSFLGMLYPELLRQSGSLIAEGLNDFHRRMRLRARPKVLLAQSFDKALELYDRYQPYICAVMSDVRIPRQGKEAPRGGVELAGVFRQRNPDLPILFQTAESEAEAWATELGAWYVDKNAPDFRQQVRRFLKESLGFGDFVFRLPDRTEVGRARDVYEMERELRTIPAESILYHASRNHFSTWLRARSMFELAQRLRPQTVADFADIEAMRRDLVHSLQRARREEQEGMITDLYSRNTGPDNRFIRVARGSIGGKGRGIAFVSNQIVQHGLLERFGSMQVRIPKTVVLGTDAFDAFMDRYDVRELLSRDDKEVTEWMLSGGIPDDVLDDLRRAFKSLKGPLAVRSSSLLEDSRFQPFAGVYATYMLPNNHANEDLRFQEVVRAVKAVYASVFWRDAQTYVAGTPHDADDQKMAVVIQQVVGRPHGHRFYPQMSGVAQSHNYYPVGGQVASEGVAHIALGLGQTVVSGGVALRFSPGSPQVLPQFPTAESILRGTQRQFWAIDLSRSHVRWIDGPESSLVQCGLDVAEADGTLELAGSVYCPQDDVIRDDLTRPGARLVTFNRVLRWNTIPLSEALSGLLEVLRDGMGEEVEIEFALDIPDGHPDDPPRSGQQQRLYVLQVRPITAPEQLKLLRVVDELRDEELVARTDLALGHGSYGGICDVVQVVAGQLDGRMSRELASRVSAANSALEGEGRPYVLIGPGRWGSSDPTLGVAVSWSDIAGARVIVETPIGSRRVEPSQGTHFFRNMTAARAGYLSITSQRSSWIDFDWLEDAWRQSGGEPGATVRHIRLPEPISVHVDGRLGRAVIVKRELLGGP